MRLIFGRRLSLIATVGLGIAPASVAAEPSFTTLCPVGYAIGLSYQGEARWDEAVTPWKLFLGGTFVQAEILNLNEWAQILCYYGGDDPRGPRLQSTGSYHAQLVREGQSCWFVQAVGARVNQLQSDFGGTKFRCKGPRDSCVVMCE
jgi:hypothetical protein